ncbi:phage tail assembly chaperone [Pseudomonas putida]|uniref:phage tail assembly chaperone n=1 Tax=Pseudomonas putida TaxID=303 RepID=UPI002363A40A|nr:phage tail assembly chaperone [Pseudomonas putida]MDD2054911.1 phage tail assembly chaperone [Pseudomonas putida]
MSYAVRNDGQGWRAVSGPDDVGTDERYSADIPSDPVPLLYLETQERTWRDGVLSAAVWLRDRHRDQLELQAPTSIGSEQFTELLVYMQSLRDWPQSPEFPESERRPIAPSWIDAQAK